MVGEKVLDIWDSCIDAQQMSHDHPGSFCAPSTRELKSIKPGQYVKVCRNRERFWIEVTTVDEDYLVGKVVNSLCHSDDLKFDQLVKFGRQHVYDITD